LLSRNEKIQPERETHRLAPRKCKPKQFGSVSDRENAKPKRILFISLNKLEKTINKQSADFYKCFFGINIQTKRFPMSASESRKKYQISSLIFPCSIASLKAIGIEAAVVFPYFWMLLKIFHPESKLLLNKLSNS
jgi:hypothetical protein